MTSLKTRLHHFHTFTKALSKLAKSLIIDSYAIHLRRPTTFNFPHALGGNTRGGKRTIGPTRVMLMPSLAHAQQLC